MHFLKKIFLLNDQIFKIQFVSFFFKNLLVFYDIFGPMIFTSEIHF